MFGVDFKNASMDNLYEGMAQGFMGSVRGIFSAIPIGLLLTIGGLFLAGAIYSFLKEIKVI